MKKKYIFFYFLVLSTFFMENYHLTMENRNNMNINNINNVNHNDDIMNINTNIAQETQFIEYNNPDLNLENANKISECFYKNFENIEEAQRKIFDIIKERIYDSKLIKEPFTKENYLIMMNGFKYDNDKLIRTLYKSTIYFDITEDEVQKIIENINKDKNQLICISFYQAKIEIAASFFFPFRCEHKENYYFLDDYEEKEEEKNNINENYMKEAFKQKSLKGFYISWCNMLKEKNDLQEGIKEIIDIIMEYESNNLDKKIKIEKICDKINSNETNLSSTGVNQYSSLNPEIHIEEVKRKKLMFVSAKKIIELLEELNKKNNNL